MIGIIWPLAALFNFINAILWLMHNINFSYENKEIAYKISMKCLQNG